jgi:CoA:oxalate CoA-transferase
MIIELEHPAAGKYKSPGFPIKFSETRGKFDMPSPLLGQHNEEILVIAKKR